MKANFSYAKKDGKKSKRVFAYHSAIKAVLSRKEKLKSCVMILALSAAMRHQQKTM